MTMRIRSTLPKTAHSFGAVVGDIDHLQEAAVNLLEGALQRRNHSAATRDAVAAWLGKFLAEATAPPKQEPKNCKLRPLAIEGAKARGFTLPELMAPSRQPPITQARQAVMLAQKRAGYTLAEIGRFWGFDHSSVSSACTAAAAREKESK